ncbi:MAG: sigma-70 family RNA polymerase sigma factor [Bryobacteraceae bacterium]
MQPQALYAAATSAEINANGALARHIAEGDPGAMELLYVLLFRASRHMLARRLRDYDPEDFVHETLAIVVEAIRHGDLRNPAALPGYLKAVIRRQGALYIERKCAARRRLVEAGSFIDGTTLGQDPEAQLIARERSDLMLRGLGYLCQRDCELMTRFYLREESLQQICDEMHISQTQFRLYKSRAKAKLTAWARTLSKS